MIEIGQVVPVPREIAESGYVKIVGDATNAQPNPFSVWGKWEYLAVEYDLESNENKGSAFTMTKEEVTSYAE